MEEADGLAVAGDVLGMQAVSSKFRSISAAFTNSTVSKSPSFLPGRVAEDRSVDSHHKLSGLKFGLLYYSSAYCHTALPRNVLSIRSSIIQRLLAQFRGTPTPLYCKNERPTADGARRRRLTLMFVN